MLSSPSPPPPNTVLIPTITTDPMDMCVPTGTTFTLAVVATSQSLQYQWFSGSPPSGTAVMNGASGGVTVSGALSSMLTIMGATADAMYYVMVSNAAGSVNSAAAEITICKQLCMYVYRCIIMLRMHDCYANRMCIIYILICFFLIHLDTHA